MRKIILDIETKNEFADVGTNDPAALDIAIVGIYDSRSEAYLSFREEELPHLWPILERADLLIGFNSDHFDLPLLKKYYPGDLSRIRSIDLLKEVRGVLGRRIKLDTLAEATLGKKKIGNGLEALRWWRNGEIEKVRGYCLEDVRLTKELYEYALRHGHFKYRDGAALKEIVVDTSRWEEGLQQSLTHTLPF